MKQPTPLLALALLSALAPAHAQTAPDAGSLLQQIEQGRKATLPPARTETSAAPEPMQPRAGVQVTVKQFRFVGNLVLGDAALAPAVAGYLGRPLNFNQLQDAAAAVAAVYREAGWVARVYLPQQEIGTDGIITIQIVEALFGGVQIEGGAPPRMSKAQIQRLFAAQQTVGELLSANALDRALLLADDLPGVSVAGALREGTKARETELVVKLADEPLIVGEASLDNTGSRSTGSERLAANINVNSPFGLGDLLSANLLHTKGSDYGRLGFTLPVGADGWRIGANASTLAYDLVTAEFAPLNASGTSDTAGLEASYPLIRSRLKNLYLTGAIEHKRFDNQSLGATTSHYRIAVASLGASGNSFDNFGGGGANSASLALVSGEVDLDGSPNQAADAATARSAGRYHKLRFNLSRQQALPPLGEAFTLYAALSGQQAQKHKNLDTSEKFYLGGAGGVRAYPASEGGGSSGVLGSLELRWRLPEGFVASAFHDAGAVRNYDGSKSYRLAGSGLALAWQSSFGLNLKAVWARRHGDNPNPTATGRDQDGSLDEDRLWLTASQSF